MEKFVISSSPHFKSGNRTAGIMLAVIGALLPSAIAGCIYFGLPAVGVIVVGIASAVIAEAVTQKLMRQPVTVSDFSAVLTGLLLALNLPSTTPLWIVALGSVLSIVVAKQMFGGLGCNFVNPALLGRIVVTLCFTEATSRFLEPFAPVDAVSGATLLNSIQSGGKLPGLWQVFIGNHAGCIGETCSAALILGGIVLIALRIISPIIPISYIATTYAMTALFGHSPLYSVLSGGLLIGAIFMATDYVTSPLTARGKLIFGIGCGLITAVIRIWGSNAEGVSYAIVFMNVLTPLIDRATMRRSPFASSKKKREVQGA